MPGILRIVLERHEVTADEPFSCTVHISHALPGDLVTVRLAETAGVPPFYSSSADAPIAGDGSGVAVFPNVVLAGPCLACLHAQDLASTIPLVDDHASLMVVAP